MLTKDDNLLFLENKIQEIKIAIFRAEINSELQLPNNIISTIKTDGEGNVWFFTSCSRSYSKNIDKHFFGSLEYYQKGQDCRLRVSGKASIVEEDTEVDSSRTENDKSVNNNVVLIKLKIMYAEYVENRQSLPISIKKKVKTFFSAIFIPHSHRLYDFT